MYPVVRVAKELFKYRNAPRLALGETHVSHHVCWPWDIDIFLEMNNGRTLTLFDIGRIVMFQRMGLNDTIRRHGLGGTIAGSSVRYRRRVRAFDRRVPHVHVEDWAHGEHPVPLRPVQPTHMWVNGRAPVTGCRHENVPHMHVGDWGMVQEATHL